MQPVGKVHVCTMLQIAIPLFTHLLRKFSRSHIVAAGLLKVGALVY